MKYLVAYDIADPKRLRRVARWMEKHALRCQKSVFLFEGTVVELRQVLDGAAQLIDPDQDLVQAWNLAPREVAAGAFRGTPLHLCPPAVIVQDRQVITIEEPYA